MNLKGNKKLLKYFILIISFLSGFVIIFNIYGYVLHQNNSNKSMEYLSEITKQTANSLNKRINDEFDKLKSMALLIGRQGNMDASKLMSVLKQEKDQNGYKKIGIALKDGSAYISDGKKENVKDDDFFKQALTGKTTLSDTFTDQSDHNPVNIYSTPIYNNGKIVGVLFTYENNNKFLNSLEVSLFGGQGSLYIVSDNGDYVFRTEKTSTATQQDGNLFSVIEKSQLDPQYNADMIKKRMSSNEGGMFLYGSKSQGRHLHYYPLNINGWYVFFSVPASAINQELHDIEIVVFCLNVVMLLICTAFMMYVVFAQNKSKQTIEKAKNRIEAITANIPGAVQRRKNDEFFSITYLSDGFYKMVEYTRSEIKELFDDKFINMIHQDDMNDVSKKILTKLKRGTKIEMQYRICTKNRGYIWVLDNCIITDSMTSEISNIDSVMVEITEL
ncbi:MAG: putative signaling protein, partial [Oscillospiraceae bacterium]|nr:putative signaling protein [Oscillospiraceae bacterium]